MKRDIGEPSPPLEAGDTRIVRKFLWWPRTLLTSNGTLQKRWLEWANIKQKYTYWGRDFDWNTNRWYAAYCWKTIRWAEEMAHENSG